MTRDDDVARQLAWRGHDAGGSPPTLDPLPGNICQRCGEHLKVIEGALVCVSSWCALHPIAGHW